jgi:DNA replication and repair protein RecF
LDDIFDKFDAHRVTRIMEMVARHEFGQIFITDTDADHLKKILSKLDTDYRIFKIDGEIEVMSE